MPVLIGLFAISQIFVQLEERAKGIKQVKQQLTNILPGPKELLDLFKVIIPSSFLGTAIGVIPGTGGAIASFLAYNEAKRFSKDPDSFGKGNPAGVAAPEAANNGTTGGAMVPLLTLGIPGRRGYGGNAGRPDADRGASGADAVYRTPRYGAGHLRRSVDGERPDFAAWNRQCARVPVGLAGAGCDFVPAHSGALCFIGSFALGNSTWNMFIALAFGVIGYAMRKCGFPAAPVILGVILGPIAEDEMGKALITAYGDWSTFIKSPIAIFFYVISTVSVTYSLLRDRMTKKSQEG